jgi:Tfp pilus assembly protein PilF
MLMEGTTLKKVSIHLAAALIALFVAATASAQAWRGMARLQGTVVDQNGAPVKGAKVMLKSVKANGGPDAIVSDAKGRWAALGLIGGGWNVDVTAEGFEPRAMSIELSEVNRIPPMKVQLAPAAPPPPPAAEQQQPEQKETIQVGGVEISPEIAEAIDKANTAMKEQKWKDAVANYEKATAVLSDNKSLKFALARAYYGAGELKKAIAMLQGIYNADTGNVTAATLLANMLIEDSQFDAGKKVIADMPPGAVTDPDVYINIGILFINKAKPADAYTFFDRAVSIAPESAAGYYYRALASLQQNKNAAAKADLKKTLELAAPDSAEAKDAKELLAQMK